MTKEQTGSSTHWAITVGLVVVGGVVATAILLTTDWDGSTHPNEPLSQPSGMRRQAAEAGRAGDETEVHSALMNAAVAQEAYFVEHQTYAMTLAELEQVGLRFAPDVTLGLMQVREDGYCMEAQHMGDSAHTYSYDSEVGDVREETCN